MTRDKWKGEGQPNPAIQRTSYSRGLFCRYTKSAEEMKNTAILRFVTAILLVLSVCAFAAETGLADKVLIEKKARKLTLYSKGQAIRVYKIALGRNPEGPKEKEGDNKTPEGIYVMDARNSKSGYHQSLHISYPNENDKKQARQLGASPGGAIMIHGMKNGFGWVGHLHTWIDWTRGCIAVTDEEIDEISRLVPNGTVVEIRP